MIIDETEYSDKMFNYLQQASIKLNELTIEAQGEVLGYSDYEKFYISISYESSDRRCNGRVKVSCKDLELRKSVWKILGRKVSLIDDGAEYPLWLDFDKLNFNVLLVQLNVKSTKEEEL